MNSLIKEKSPLIKRKTGKVVFAAVRGILCIGFAYTILYPLLMMLTRAFMSADDLYDNSVMWLPKTLTLDTVRAMMKVLHYS